MSAFLATATETPMSLTLVLVSLVTILWAVRSWFKPKLPPGPTPIPLVGNMLQMKGKPAWEKAQVLSQQYGPVFTYYFGPSPTVILNSHDALTEAFVTRGNDFANKPQLPSSAIFSGDFHSIAFVNMSEALRHRRKVAMQCLRQYLTEDQHSERVHQIVQMTVKRMVSDKDNSETGTINLNSHLVFCLANILHSICFGSILEGDSPKFKEFMDIFDFLNSVDGRIWEDSIPFLKHFPTQRFKNAKLYQDKFEDYVKGQVDKEKARWERGEGSDYPSLAQRLFVAQKRFAESGDESMQDALKDRNLLWTMNDLFFAGVDTTRSTLEFAFLIFSEKPEVQEMLRDCVDEVIGTGIPGREHRPRLALVESALQEVLRMVPAAPMGLRRETTRPTKVMGYDLPANLTVLGNLYAVQRDPKYWEDPDEYRPKRFLKEDGSLTSSPPAFMPFSIGSRACVGQFMAKQTLLYVACGLLQKLEFQLPPGVQADLKPNPEAGFFIAPKHHDFIVKQRQSSEDI